MKKIMILCSAVLLLAACSNEVEPVKEEGQGVEDQIKQDGSTEQVKDNQDAGEKNETEENTKEKSEPKLTKDEKKQLEEVKDILQSKPDEELQSQLLAENGVNSAVVKIMKELDSVFITVEVKETVIKADADKLAEKYAKLAKQQYKNFSTYVFINQSGKELIMHTIE